MPAEVDPPELAHLLDLAERPRVSDWSLRAALVRYGQPQPLRINAILDLVRRLEAALKPSAKVFERDGNSIWAEVVDNAAPPAAHAELVELLRAAAVLDRLGDRLAAWAAEPAATRPDEEVDLAVADVAARLDALGVPREQREGPPRRRP